MKKLIFTVILLILIMLILNLNTFATKSLVVSRNIENFPKVTITYPQDYDYLYRVGSSITAYGTSSNANVVYVKHDIGEAQGSWAEAQGTSQWNSVLHLQFGMSNKLTALACNEDLCARKTIYFINYN